jgi:ABC-type nitrate/sulfonate/bicarbonate transport system substrate-binding protein
LNNISSSQVKVYPAQFDPSPLPAGTVDGWFSFFTNEPNLLKVKGVDTYVFLLDSFGYHLLDNVYITQSSYLTDATKKAQVVALMTGEVRGWQDANANPSEGADLAVNVFGKSLGNTVAEQLLEAQAAVQLVESDVTKTHGLFYMDPTAVSQTIATLGNGGIKAETSLFTNEILQAVYQGKTTL